MTPEAQQQLRSALGDVKVGVQSLLEKVDDQGRRVSEVEQKLSSVRKSAWASLPGVDGKKFSLAKAVYGASTGDWSRSGYEKEVFENTRKAMDTGTSGSGGGYIVPQQAIQDVIELLKAKAVVIQSGARLLEDLVGSPVVIPKQLSSGSAYWVGQNQTIMPSDASFGQIMLTPKILAMRTQVSNLLALISNPKAEEVLRADFARVAALELDRVALRGSGASNEPLGVSFISGIGTLSLGTNGADYSFDNALDTIGVLADANALEGKPGFVMHPKVVRKLKKLRIPQFSGDTAGAYVVTPIISDRLLSEMLGYGFASTTQLPINLVKGSSTDCSQVFFGNWEELLLGMWGGLEILASNVAGNAWTQNAIEVRLIMNCDVQVRHAASFCVISDAKTT